MDEEETRSSLWKLFLAKNKAEFTKLASKITLSSKDLRRAAIFASAEITSLRYMIGEKVSQPVKLTDKDWREVERTKKSRKLLAAINQNNRVMFYVFWFEYKGDKKPWWIIWHDLRDRETRGNHWKATGAPHAHMISYLTHPRDCLEKYITSLTKDSEYSLPHAVHIRFEDDKWQDIRWGT